jgi:4-amino-4-deoxy-L-arabinose transferase-like glycosyltransferase
MSDTLEEVITPALSQYVEDRPNTSPSRLWQRLGLGGVMLVSIFMNFFQLGQNGFANTYYAAAIRSMLDNWHNFFFVAFDPGGFVSVDKPPLGFWLQAASAKIFGFTPFSIFLPQALAGVLSVLLLYHLVRRHFGVVAGLLAALALAISPISVLTNRNNTIDSTLVLVMLLGAWTVLKAAEKGKLRWLLLCAVFVGLGFNIKMLEAYLVVPAYGLLYLLAAPRRIWIRIAHLALAALLMLTISLSWAVAVDLTPAASRPYVGSSQNNSELSLALGYNGIQRLIGQVFGGNSGATNTGNTSGNITPGQFPPSGTFNGGNFPRPEGGRFGQPPQGFGGGNGGGGGMFNTGNPGLLRLFNEPLGGQIVWLLPIALLGILALAWQRRPRFRGIPNFSPQQCSMILWSVWLLTMAVFFSAASFFHQYYLSTLAPAICALFGIGAVVMWQDYRRSGWRGWLLPLALLLTALEQIHIIVSNPSWGIWLIPLIAIPCAIAAAILIAARLMPRLRLSARVLAPALCVALLALILTSAVWSAIPVLANQAANLPVAGPSGQTGTGFGGGNSIADTALITYLEAHKGNAKYLVAVISANEADAIILATNQPVMALGGFTGSDPILTTTELAALVKNGTVRYFLLNGAGGSGPGGGQSALTTWITQHATAVPSSQWQSSSSTSGGFGGAGQLYEFTSGS